MLKAVDNILNGISMYRLVLYLLISLVLVSIILSFLQVLPYKPIDLIIQTSVLSLICWLVNKVFAKIFKAPQNPESPFITALILCLIITPQNIFENLFFIFLASIFAIASKYILQFGGKHIFNPAAFGVAATAIFFNYSAGWWVGNLWMIPFVVICGLLIVRKIKRFDMVAAFLSTALVVFGVFALFKGNNLFTLFQKISLETPLIFFASVMLTEPQTMPPSKKWKVIYGIIVGILFASPFSVGYFTATPENALILGNIFSYLVGFKRKLTLYLKEKKQIGLGIYDFVFNLKGSFSFLPGQYLEWTLGHKNPDSRGVRRFFTIASSPTEQNLHIGIRFFDQGSSFKKSLINMRSGESIIASQLDGEFVLPKDPSEKLVFIAGGIGITPFRSMIKYLLDKEEKRDIVLFYLNRSEKEIVYKEIFDEAFRKLKVKTVCVLTDRENVPKGWKGLVGHLDDNVIKQEVSDYKERIFYISGSHSMVEAFKEVLKGLGIPGNRIKTDYFPGYA